MVFFAVVFFNLCFALNFEYSAKFNGPSLQFSKKFSMFKLGDMFGNRSPFLNVTVEHVIGKKSLFAVMKEEEYLQVYQETDPVSACKGKIKFQMKSLSPGKNFYRKVDSTGLYTVVMLVCDNDLEVKLNIQSINPFGHLTGGYVLLLPFYVGMSIIYLCFFTFWGCSLFTYYNFAISIQKYCIPLMLTVCILEHSLNFWYWDYINLTGNSSVSLLIVTVLAKSLRDALGRSLLLAASHGWGIVDDNPPFGKCIIYVCGVLYFLFDVVYEGFSKTYAENELWVLMATTLPLVLTNALIFYFVFAWFAQVYVRLQQMGQVYKINLLRKFACVLFVGGFVSVLWTVVEVVTKSFLQVEEYWTGLWLYIGIWDLIFMLMTVSFMIIWKIDENSQILAHAYQIRSDDDLSSEREGNMGIELSKK